MEPSSRTVQGRWHGQGVLFDFHRDGIMSKIDFRPSLSAASPRKKFTGSFTARSGASKWPFFVAPYTCTSLCGSVCFSHFQALAGTPVKMRSPSIVRFLRSLSFDLGGTVVLPSTLKQGTFANWQAFTIFRRYLRNGSTNGSSLTTAEAWCIRLKWCGHRAPGPCTRIATPAPWLSHSWVHDWTASSVNARRRAVIDTGFKGVRERC
mmetsp:Transcript_36081/g.48816  ORF Transcript_36081/g.48816 Transcript_36081/m.48816 type:complete len:207 (+) Transcript_36081:1068-1688(+)